MMITIYAKGETGEEEFKRMKMNLKLFKEMGMEMRIFDAHFHIIDFDFPIIENQGYLPPSYVVEDYKNEIAGLDVLGGAIVSGSFQGFDQGYLLKALKQMGTTFFGVTQLPYTVTDEEILSLNEKGVKALRFNIKRGGAGDLSKLDYFARSVYDLVGWHSELYIDAKDLPEIAPAIAKLPAISIDHLGLSEEGLPHLLKLVDQGVRVKATGFGRAALNIENALKSNYDINPDSLMFGTDLPSTRANRRFAYTDIELIRNLFDEQAADKILYTNALKWYTK
jgi:predicted TIM-barrel fold metal-dependent hydrolase